MGLFDFIKNIFSGDKQADVIDFYVRDDKCGNEIKIVFRKGYDIVREYGDGDEAYSVRKVAICDECYNKINISLKFDNKYNIVSQDVENGEIITKEDYYS